MRNGFSFNGKHTSEFAGVTVKTQDRPIFPAVKESTVSADKMHGEYDFSEVNGGEYYQTRNIQIDFQIVANGLLDLQKKVTALSKWFKGRGVIIFDDIPFVKWDARVIDSVSYMPEHSGGKAVLSVTYKAQPLTELVFTMQDGPELDTVLEIDSNVPLDTSEYVTLIGGEDTIAYENIPNISDVAIKPVITVTGAVSPFTISCEWGEADSRGRRNYATLTVNESGDFVIDCDKAIVYSGQVNLMTSTTGDFFELAPGLKNRISISAAESVVIGYAPKYLYNVDFDTTEWGDGPEEEAPISLDM